MYADDIVIISTSVAGLQDRLRQLEKYCSEWCLKVNINKTKVLIFNKAGRKIKNMFYFQNENLECVNNYNYYILS